MATITLYAGKINQMPGLINEVKKSVVDYKSELSALRKKTLNINRSVCNLDEVISSIQASSQTQDRKIDSLEKFCSESEKFISEVVRIDEEVAELINKRKENFYKEYYYLKPESEKSGWEKIKDGLKAVAEWCKENWKSIAKIVAAAVVITGLGMGKAVFQYVFIKCCKILHPYEYVPAKTITAFLHQVVFVAYYICVSAQGVHHMYFVDYIFNSAFKILFQRIFIVTDGSKSFAVLFLSGNAYEF